MRLDKPAGSKNKVSISPSRALVNEANRQVENGMWESRTEFFEASAWLMVEMQSLGIDLLSGAAPDEEFALGDQTVSAADLVDSHTTLELHIHEHQPPTPSNDSDSDSDSADRE